MVKTCLHVTRLRRSVGGIGFIVPATAMQRLVTSRRVVTRFMWVSKCVAYYLLAIAGNVKFTNIYRCYYGKEI